MTLNNLFEKVDHRKDSLWVLKDAINVVAYGKFSKAVSCWLQGIGYSYNGNGCDFAEKGDEFDGVCCYYNENYEVVISEEVFFEHLKIAIQRYIELNPDKKDELEQIVSQSTLI